MLDYPFRILSAYRGQKLFLKGVEAMMIWRGFGFLVPVIWVAGLVLTEMMIGEQTYEHHGWPKFVACLVGAIGIAIAGGLLNQDRAPGNTHTFFFVDMRVWALVSVAAGIFLAMGSY
jgi:hypothetical protein